MKTSASTEEVSFHAEEITALRSPASGWPMNKKFFLPSAPGRIAFSTRLLSISKIPSATIRPNIEL